MENILPKEMLEMDTTVKIWYGCLVTITLFNIHWYFHSIIKSKISSSPSSSSSSPSHQFSYSTYHYWMKIFSGIYVFGCSIRALLPRIDVERICLFENILSFPIVGRILATFAELSFMAQLTMTLYFIASHLLPQNNKNNRNNNKNNNKFEFLLPIIRVYAKLCFCLNIIAQCSCWMGITTTVQIWHVYEESIWAFTIGGMTLCYLLIYFSSNISHSKNVNVDKAKRFMKLFLIFGPLYVAYMCTIDIPMYYNRHNNNILNNNNENNNNNSSSLSFFEGLENAANCKIISGKHNLWVEDFSWMLGYFSAAVWTSIYLINGLSP